MCMHAASITLGQKLAADASAARTVDSHHNFQEATATEANSAINLMDMSTKVPFKCVEDRYFT